LVVHKVKNNNKTFTETEADPNKYAAVYHEYYIMLAKSSYVSYPKKSVNLGLE